MEKFKTYSYKNSQDLFKKAVEVIPCGIYGHFSPSPLVPATAYPFFASRAQDAHIWDIDGNEFIDYMCAYGPMVLGYKNETVDHAYQEQMKQIDCATSPGEVMVRLAEKFVQTVDMADWAFFAKNGADVTAFSRLVARTHTGRKKFVRIQGGYHGTAPWAQSPGHAGIIADDHVHDILIPWNDVDAFEDAVKQNKGDIAGFMSTPYHTPAFTDNIEPAPGYWKAIRSICDREGIVLIIDDVRCGFRLSTKGSDNYYGFKADLMCFCKAIGNGYPISAMCGTNEMKNAAGKAFHTGSYWYAAGPMAAGLACITELARLDGAVYMQAMGRKLCDGLVALAKKYGYELKVTGNYAMPYLRIVNDPSLMLHQDWCAEATKRGAFFTSHHNWFLSCKHTDADIAKTLEIADEAFQVVKAKYGTTF